MRKLSGYGPSLVVLITAAVVLWAAPRAVRQITYHETRARIIQARQRLDTSDVLHQFNQAYRDIADYVEPSVVHISAQQQVRDRFGELRSTQSSGSGWVWDELGHIVTNYHVVEDAENVQVQLHDGDLRDAEIVGFDRLTDIAVLKVRGGQLHAADLADADASVQRGDLVFAFGSPFDFRFSMTSGVVSGMARSVGVLRTPSWAGYESFIQIDAAINPGNSGGPLTDYRGQVIGMATAIATGSGRRSSFEEGQFAGIGLAIPLRMIEPAVTQIIEKGYASKGYLGIVPGEIDPDERRQLQSRGFGGPGVTIDSFSDDGPAIGTELREGDVITAINGYPVGSRDELRSLVSSFLPGETVAIDVWRNDPLSDAGETLTTSVDLAELPQGRAELLSRQTLFALGIRTMAPATRETAAYYGTELHAGVVILSIIEGSRLDRQGVRPGWVVTELRGFAIEDEEDLLIHLDNADLERGIVATMLDTRGKDHRVELRFDR